MIIHYDLFAGIGGFSLALEEVFTDETIRHIFCEWESFPAAVLKKHWPDGEFHGDIAELVAHTRSAGLEEARAGQQAAGSRRGSARQSVAYTEQEGLERWSRPSENTPETSRRKESTHGGVRQLRDLSHFTIVTGGFPCQPFRAAGRRRGTADDRYQWPNMFEVIRNTKPEWVIAENVRGLVTWNEGMVLEQVCSDLESEGYEVQPLIIPAVAVGAPHRRDRVWIIAHTVSNTDKRPLNRVDEKTDGVPKKHRQEWSRTGQSVRTTTMGSERPSDGIQDSRGVRERTYPDWARNWQEVAFATCDDSVDDGLSRIVDGIPYSRAKWRKESLKAYGNAIVPEVAVNIMQAIKDSLTKDREDSDG